MAFTFFVPIGNWWAGAGNYAAQGAPGPRPDLRPPEPVGDAGGQGVQPRGPTTERPDLGPLLPRRVRSHPRRLPDKDAARACYVSLSC
jgi:hypothetical protein